MDGIGNGENNAPPLGGGGGGGGEAEFLQDLRRNLPWRLYRIGFATSATAVGGLVEHIVAATGGRAGAATQAYLLPLSVALFGAFGTIYAGHRVETAPTQRWRNAGIVIYFFCLMLLVAAVGLVGSDYCDLALNFMDG